MTHGTHSRFGLSDYPDRVLEQWAHGAETGFSIRDLILELWLRRRLVATIGFGLFLLCAGFILLKEPRYSATSSIMIDLQKPTLTVYDEVFASLPNDATTLQTEVQQLLSRDLIRSLVLDLDLHRHPAFAPDQDGDGVAATIAAKVRSLLPFGSDVAADQADERLVVAKTVDNVLEALSVGVEGNSRILSVTMTSTDPTVVAPAVNKLTELYIDRQVSAKRDLTQSATVELEGQIADLRRQVREAEDGIEAYRAEAGLTEGADTTILAQRLSGVTAELIHASGERAQAEARLQQVQGAGGNPEAVVEVLDSDLIQNLLEEESELNADLAELSTVYGQRHPRFIEVASRIDRLQEWIRIETDKVIEGLRNNLVAATARENQLRGMVDALEAEMAAVKQSEVELRQREREVAVGQALLDGLLSRTKEISVGSLLESADARIVSQAEPSIRPDGLPKLLLLMLSLPFGFGVGIVGAFAAILWDHSLRTSERAETISGLPTLGKIPLIDHGELDGGGRGRYASLNRMRRLGPPPDRCAPNEWDADFGSSIFELFIAILGEKRGASVVLLTSALPSEGKTCTAISLARLAAQGGRRVVLIDADLRRPTVARRVQTPDGPGLSELIAGTCSLEKTIFKDPMSELRVMPCGSPDISLAGQWSLGRIRALFGELRDACDLVIVDSAPVLAANEAKMLAALVDQVVLVTRCGSTPEPAVRRALRMLHQAGAPVSGVALSMVKRRDFDYYAYGYHGYASHFTSPAKTIESVSA